MRTIFYIVGRLLMLGCQKEDALESKIDYVNLYEITDSPEDSVQHLRYELYKNYNVSVYFTDTVGKYFLKNDIYGNPVYRYELLDLNWEFSSNASENREIDYYFITDEGRKMNSLRFVRNFVENCAQSLRPLSMLLTDSLLVLEDASVGWQRKTEIHNFRMIAWGEVADLTAEESEELINETCKGLVGEKIQNYTSVLTRFQLVSDKYYNRNWPSALPYYSDCIIEEVNEDDPFSNGGTWFYQQYIPLYMSGKSHEEAIQAINEKRAAYCEIVGNWGFVYGYGRLASTVAPTASDDLDCYVERILSDHAEEWFEKYYATYPLVMKKYELLRDLIENEMGVKLK